MNDDLQTFIEPELEARIVALVLGEASAFEAEELERLMAEKPELNTFRTGLEKIHGVVGEAHREQDDSEWKLSEDMRGKIQAKIEERKRDEMVEARRKRISRIAQRRLIYTCAACLVLTLVILGLTRPMGSMKKGAPMASDSAEPKMSRAAVMEKIDKEIVAQSDLVQEHRKDLTVLVQQYGIPYFDGGDSESLGMSEQQMFKNARKRLSGLETEGDKLEIEIKNRIQNGESAEKVAPLSNKLELVERQVSRIKEMVDDRKEDAIDLSLKKSNYDQAKEAYEQSNEMLREMKLKRLEVVGGSDAVTQAMDEETLSFEWKSDGKDLEKWNYSKDTPETWDRFISEERSKKGQVSEALADLNDALAISPAEPQIVANLEKKAEARHDRPQSRVTGQPTAPTSAPKPASPAKRGMVASNFTSTAAIKVPEIPDPASDFGDGFGIVDNEGMSSGGVVAGGIGPVAESGGRPNAVSLGDVVDKLDLEAGEAFSSAADPFSAPAQESKESEALPTATRSKKKSTVVSGYAVLDSKENEARGGESRGRQAGFEALENSGSSLNEKSRITSMPATEPTPSDEESVSTDESDSPGQAWKPIEEGSPSVDGTVGLNLGFDDQPDEDKEGVGKVQGLSAVLPGNSDSDPFADSREVRGNFFQYEPSDADPFSDNGGDPDPFAGGDYDTDGIISRSEVGGSNLEMDIQSARAVPHYGEPTPEDLQVEKQIAQLNEVIIPEINFEDTTVAEAIEFLERKTREGNPEKGVDIQVRTPKTILSDGEEGFGEVVDSSEIKIKDLQLRNVPARVALQYVADAARLRYKVDKGGVTLLPVTDGGDADIVQNRWDITPEVARELREATANGKSIVKVLKEQGISFPQNASASFLDDENMLIMRNSPTNMELMDGIVTAAESFAKAKTRTREAEWLLGETRSDTSGASEGEILFPEEEQESLPSFPGSESFSVDGERSVINPLNQIILPEVNFNNMTFGEALEALRQRSIELDNTTIDESQKGINLVVDDASLLSRKLPKIEMKDVPLSIVLDRMSEATGTTKIVDEFAVRFGREDSSDIFTGATGDGNRVTVAKLHQIIIPEFQFKQVTVEEAVEFIKLRSIELDNISEESEKGFEVSVEEGVDQQALVEQLTLRNVPVRIAIEEIARQAGCKVRIDGTRVVFFPDPNRQKKDVIKGFETSTKEKTDSTFSLNVSDVSFKLAKAALSQGNWPDASKVRPEEFVNALSYNDLKPTQAEKISCEIEQGSHPFMQQRNLMRVSMSTASLGRNAATPLRLTILLDQSGSMERADRAESVQRAFALLAAQLNPNDEVTLVGFARTPRLLAERVKGNEVAKLAGFVANPLTEGGTNLEEALSTGLQLAKQQFLKGAQNRIILLTDGAANLGDAKPKNLASQVESMRRANIAFDACGVGADGLNDDVLSSLTKQGDGRYYFLDRPEDADDGFARQIAGALRPAAKNVKVQVLFNPERVSTFKLYGFEKHKLKKEDFRNDSVDAAEMAAEESGVALYHFEPMPEGRGDIGTVSVRFFDTASRQMVERTWSIPYQEEAEFFSKADPRLRLASVAALFAEKLKGSPVGDRVELKKLRQEAQLLKPSFANQTRFNELQNMLQQAGD